MSQLEEYASTHLRREKSEFESPKRRSESESEIDYSEKRF